MPGMKYNIPDRLMKDITRTAEKYGVETIVLFGSRARGSHSDRSDVDLAVKCGFFDGFCEDLKENAHSLLMFDLIDLNGPVSNELKNEIERDGIVIYEKA